MEFLAGLGRLLVWGKGEICMRLVRPDKTAKCATILKVTPAGTLTRSCRANGASPFVVDALIPSARRCTIAVNRSKATIS